MHLLETPNNPGVAIQALGRQRQSRNPAHNINYFEYYVADTMDDTRVRHNIYKAIPEARALLNKAVFFNGEDSFESFEIGRWVVYKGELTRAKDVASEGLPILTG